MKQTLRLILAAVFLLAAPTLVVAQPYVFMSFASAKASTVTTPATTDSDLSNLNVGAGYGFSKNFAFELGYLSLGKFRGANASWTASGFGLSGVGTLPVSGPWAAVGKLGVYDLESTLDVAPTTRTKTDLGSLVVVGIGAQYRIEDNIQLRAMLEQINGKSGSELDKVRLFSLGAKVSF